MLDRGCMPNECIESSWSEEDKIFEVPLRPQSLLDFTGQDNLLRRLEIHIGAAKKRNDALGHTLFSGPPGLGKTTLANIMAKSMGTNLVVTSGPVIEKPGDLAGLLTNLQKGDVLFIDEIHRMPKTVEEYLYSAMEDFRLDLLIDSGPNARSVQINLNPFTLVGATTRAGLLSNPIRSRFSFSGRLDYYSPDSLQQILVRSAAILNMKLDSQAAFVIAKRARGTPRIANNLLRWTRDYAQMHHKKMIDLSTSIKALEMLSIDELGLDEMDKKILKIMIDHYNGGPVGLQTLAVASGEDPTTLSEVHEPFLILNGFIKRTLRGREVTSLAYEHLGLNCPEKPLGDQS